MDSRRPRHAQTLFSGAAHGYGPMATLLSFGQYRRWHRRLVEAARDAGLGRDDRVLDVATGTGLIARDLRRTVGCEVTGLDLTRAMLESARRDDDPLPLVQASATHLPFSDAAYDALTFSYLYRYVDDPVAVTREMVRVVRPGGFVGFVEFHIPPNPAWRTLWRAHTRINLPLGGALGGPGWYRVGRFLGPNIDAFYADKQNGWIKETLTGGGLGDVHVETMSLGGGVVAWGRRRYDA